MVLQLAPLPGRSSFYFDCAAISVFDNEDEYLFFGGDSPLKIITIENIVKNKWINYIYFLKAINFIIQLANGSEIDKTVLAEKQCKNTIKSLMKYQIQKLKINIPVYIRSLLQYHLSNYNDSVTINYTDFYNEFKFLKDLFFQGWGKLNITNICKLFFQTKWINIDVPKNFELDKEFVDLLCNDLIQLSSQSVDTKIDKITFNFGNKSIKQNILKKIIDIDKFKKIGWMIHVTHNQIQCKFAMALFQAKQEILTKKLFEKHNPTKDFDEVDPFTRCIVHGYAELFCPSSFISQDIEILIIAYCML